MALVPHKVTALAESDADGTSGKNIVAGAVVSLFDDLGGAITLYDDESGTNPSTTKTTGSNGQVVVWVTPGEYDEAVNGSTLRKITIPGRASGEVDTFANLQLYRPTRTGQAFVCQARANAKYIVQAAGYVAQPGDVTFANGRVGALQIPGSEAYAGWFGVTTTGDTSAQIQDMFDRLSSVCSAPNNGAKAIFGTGVFTCQGVSVPSRLTIIGSGRTTTIFKLPNSATSDYIFADGGYVTNTTFSFPHITVRDCGFDGNKANNTGTKALFIIKGYRASFAGVGFSNSAGWGCLYTDTSDNGTLNTSGLAENTWLKCHFDLNDQAGLYCESNGSNQIADATISECIFNQNSLTVKEADLYSERSAGFKVLNNQLYGGGYHNIYLRAFSRGKVSGNHCDLTAGAATAGDDVSAIHVPTLSQGGAAVINDNPIFLHVDGAATSVNAYGFTLAGTTESLSVVGNSIGQDGNGGQAYNILGQQLQAVYNNSLNNDVALGSDPYASGATWAGIGTGTYTPTVAFFTPGDSSISYSSQQGHYVRSGKHISFNARVTFSTNAYTTANGSLRLTLPFTAQDVGVSQNIQVGIMQNINYSGGSEAYSAGAYAIAGQDKMEIFINVDNTTQQTVTTSQVAPSGTYTIYYGGTFLAE